jgi:hypothetical protein
MSIETREFVGQLCNCQFFKMYSVYWSQLIVLIVANDSYSPVKFVFVFGLTISIIITVSLFYSRVCFPSRLG